jgi:hypothetical protein
LFGAIAHNLLVIVVDRLLQIGVIVFDYASMPFNFVVERILLKSIVIDGRDLKLQGYR